MREKIKQNWEEIQAKFCGNLWKLRKVIRKLKIEAKLNGTSFKLWITCSSLLELYLIGVEFNIDGIICAEKNFGDELSNSMIKVSGWS